MRERLFRIHESRAAGFVSNPAAMDKTAALARRLIDKQVPDPELREIVTPDYVIGCKRLLISSDWYPALSRPHVTVRPGGVAEVRPRAVVGADGAETAADVLIYAGFPNMFVMVGPNTGLGHNSQVLMIEAQARYIVDSLRRLRRRGAACMEVRPEVQDSFNDWLDSRLAGTVWQTGGCRSWYQDPRSGRNTVLWPDTTIAFWRRTRRARMSDYRLWTPR